MTVTPPERFSTSLSAESPAGWFAKESMTLLSPDGQANVIVSSEPLDPTLDTEQYAQIQDDLLRKEFPGYHESSFELVTMFGDRRGCERRFSWKPPDGVRVEQIQRYLAEAGRGYTATATTPSTQMERSRPLLEQIISSVSRAPTGVSRVPAQPESTSSGVSPLTHHMLEQTLNALGYGYQVLSEGALLAPFPLDTGRTGRDQLLVIVQLLGDARDILGVSAQIGDPHVPIERWWDAVGTANDWNTQRSWPIAFVKRRQDVLNEAEIVLRHRPWLPHGSSIEHLAGIFSDAVQSGIEFWEWAYGERGL